MRCLACGEVPDGDPRAHIDSQQHAAMVDVWAMVDAAVYVPPGTWPENTPEPPQ